MMKNILIGLAIWTLLGTNYAMAEDIKSSPLKVDAQAPVQSLGLATQLRSGFTNDKTELFATYNFGSVWITSDDIQMDYYQNRITTGVQWSPADKMQLELRYQFAWAHNNHLDSLVKSFHNAAGLKLDGRDEVEDDSFNVDSETYGVHNNNFEGDTLESAVSLYLQYSLYESEHQALAIGGSLYYNNKSDYEFSSGGFEQNLQLNWSYAKGGHSIYSTLGVVHHADKNIDDDLYFKEFTWEGAIGYGYRFLSNHEIIAEYHLYQGALNQTAFSENVNEATLGYRYYWDDTILEISGTENLFNMDNSTDIAFTVGVRHYF
ncbi:DUF3187 family protein [Vibrio mediterranei]|nr:DUF3187 family protein [Vibrio mediterranei]